MERDPDKHGRAAPEPVGDRTHDELAERPADEHAGHRQLDGGRAGAQVAGHIGQGRHVDVARDRG